MSFASQIDHVYSPVSLSLYKLSFCTTATLHANTLWEHLSGSSDMYAVFDRVRTPGLGQTVSEKQILRLIRHSNLLVCLSYAVHGSNMSFVSRYHRQIRHPLLIRNVLAGGD